MSDLMSITTWTASAAAGCSLVMIVLTVLMTRSARKKLTRIDASIEVGGIWLLRAPLLPLVLAVVFGLIALYALLLHFAFGASDFKLPSTTTGANPVLVAATLIAGALTAAYAVLRLRAHLLAESRSRLEAHGDLRADAKHRSDQEVALAERFSKAVELLAADKPISRIAGAHLILALGDEWPSGAQRCLDVLVSHLRGLRENNTLTDEAVPRGMREEVRLITSEIFRRLSDRGPHWKVRAGDFSGTALDGVELEDGIQLASLDLRGAHILGNLSIPATSSREAPLLAEICCDGDLSVEYSSDWPELDLTRATVAGSIHITGEAPPGELTGTELQAGGSLNLSFDVFRSDIMLDGAEVQEDIRVGLTTLGATFGAEGDAPVDLSLVNASFGRLALQRVTRGPRVNISGAVGVVDFTSSVLPFEVNANRLDASTGLHLRGARFEDALILDGATVPEFVELDGLFLSDTARSAIESSDFSLRDLMLAATRSKPLRQGSTHGAGFDWRSAIEPLRERAGTLLMGELEMRLKTLEANLPLDWRNKPSFAAQVTSEVARAVARADVARDTADEIQMALREVTHPSDTEGTST